MKFPIRWVRHDDPSMRGRSIDITTSGGNGAKETVSSVPVPDGEFVCDVCNDDIEQDPFPVVTGYALCRKCMIGWGIKHGDTEYVERTSSA